MFSPFTCRRTVRKEGPNTGREFYTCNNQSCNFFQWADATPAAPAGHNNNQTFSGAGRGSSTHTVPPRRRPGAGGGGGDDGDDDGGGVPRKRKCGLCRQEGHTRPKCPRHNQYAY